MGFNTTVLVLNDALSSIEKDKDFGEKLASAVRAVVEGKPVDVCAGSFVNAATVIESHHSSGLIPVIVGHNTGRAMGLTTAWATDLAEMEHELMRALASKHGYNLRKKRR